MNMIWSIGTWNEKTLKVDADHHATVDGCQLEDGIHNIYFTHDGVQTSASVVVANGEFTESADTLIGNAVERAGYWGIYIERFTFNDDNQIEVIIGS
tara:strand:+ start:224 stop:514 length:291 start_codon:yes stop_codon:yes gene_type:complete